MGSSSCVPTLPLPIRRPSPPQQKRTLLCQQTGSYPRPALPPHRGDLRTGGPGTPSPLADVVWGRMNLCPPRSSTAPHPPSPSSPHWHYGSIDDMPKLKAIMEVGGRHPSPKVLDYPACFARGIRVLSCAPAFGPMVAEMALGLTIASAREIVDAHIDFREGKEIFLHKSNKNAFTLFGQTVGFIGFGGLAQPQAYAGPLRLQDAGLRPLNTPHLCEQGVNPSAEHPLQTSRDLRAHHPVRRKSRLLDQEGWSHSSGRRPCPHQPLAPGRLRRLDRTATPDVSRPQSIFPQEPPPSTTPFAPPGVIPPHIAPAPSP